MKIKKLFYLYRILFSQNLTAYSILIYEFFRIIFLPLNSLLGFIEKFSFKSQKKYDEKIIFVIGSHRSGCTYVAQTLLRELNVYGLNNLNNIFNKSSIIVSKLSKKIPNNYGELKNYYGHTKNLFDVNDNYPVWDRWFGDEHDFIKKDNLLKTNGLNEYFSNIYNIINKPILTKNGRNVFAIKELNIIFKKSFFIIVDRDVENIIRSTKNAKKLFFKDKYSWGLKVDHYENNVEKQCIKLINYINFNVKKLPKRKVLRIKYEEFLDKKKQKKIISTIKKINEKNFS